MQCGVGEGEERREKGKGKEKGGDGERGEKRKTIQYDKNVIYL